MCTNILSSYYIKVDGAKCELPKIFAKNEALMRQILLTIVKVLKLVEDIIEVI
ncbi:hypothetical protein FACS1894113_5300 [Alphaproteobacteria bacterium]|nr:hypothetical protein FACS1894113_5300 [Alphaproteobacteria bacterium]